LRIAVTRPSAGEGEDRLSRLLAARGATPVLVPLTRTCPASDAAPLREAVGRILHYDWLVVTSARAVLPLVKALDAAGIPVSAVRSTGIRICAVGPRTAEALSGAGLPPDLVPAAYSSEAVAMALREVAGHSAVRVLFPRAETGSEVIPRALESAGASVHVVPAYRTEPDREGADRLAALVSRGDVDAVTFTAGSAARSFALAWRERGNAPTDLGVGIVALGPATTETLGEEGLRVDRTAEPHTLEGLVGAVEAWAQGKGRGPAKRGQ
jgi:uroporphyrinogen-III synthase